MYVCLYRSTGDYHRAQICGKIDCQLPTSWAGKTGGGGPSLNRREEHYWRNRGRQFLQGSNAPQEVGADRHLLNTSHAPREGRGVSRDNEHCIALLGKLRKWAKTTHPMYGALTTICLPLLMHSCPFHESLVASLQEREVGVSRCMALLRKLGKPALTAICPHFPTHSSLVHGSLREKECPGTMINALHYWGN